MTSLPHGAERFDLLCIGNAIVDVLAPVAAGEAAAHGMVPGSMTLIDAARADALEAALTPEKRAGGGSAANTAVVAALLGARTAFLGTVAADASGRAFDADMERAGIHFPTPAVPEERLDGHATARCLILVEPDGQRTMNTYLGACTLFGPADLDEAAIADSRVTYLEGYLFDPPAAQEAFRRAATVAHAHGRKVALSLSDRFCVERHRDAFRALAAGHVDILFANEDEIRSLFEVDTFEDAARLAAGAVETAVLTRGEAGSTVFHRGTRTDIAARPTRVVDTTGAGDAYAAGFLFGFTRDADMAECGRLGAVCAAEVISHLGARPEADLRALAAE